MAATQDDDAGGTLRVAAGMALWAIVLPGAVILAAVLVVVLGVKSFADRPGVTVAALLAVWFLVAFARRLLRNPRARTRGALRQ